MNEISAIEYVIKQAAIKGGQIVMDYFRRKQQIWMAKSPFEVVTEADIASEKAIISEIKQFYPEHTILSEEQGKLEGDADHTWIVDPLDGTLKFVLGEPYFSISIAYEFRGVVEIAAVYNPYTRDMYFACRDKGAFKNDVVLQVSTTQSCRNFRLL